MNKCDTCNLPPYYCENMRCKNLNINWLTAVSLLVAKLNEVSNFDEVFGEDDRIWENGVEIK